MSQPQICISLNSSSRVYPNTLLPAQTHSIKWAHSQNLPVIMHFCGFVKPLPPGMLEADTDCLHVIEVKAGMDLLRLNQAYDERLSFIGGIDMRVLYNNDHREVDAELVAKIPPGQRSSRFCAALRPFHPQQHSTRDLPLLH